MSASILETRAGTSAPTGGASSEHSEIEGEVGAATLPRLEDLQREVAAQRARLAAHHMGGQPSATLQFAAAQTPTLAAPTASHGKVLEWTMAFFHSGHETAADQLETVERLQQEFFDNELALFAQNSEEAAEDEQRINKEDQRNRDRTIAQNTADLKQSVKKRLDRTRR